MDEDAIQSEIANFKRQIAALSDKIEDLESNMVKLKTLSEETFLKAQEAKHSADKTGAYLQGFIEISKTNQEAIQRNQESISELLNAKRTLEEKLAETINYLKGWQSLTTLKGFEEFLKENRENTYFRLQRISFSKGVAWILAGIVTVIGAMLSGIALAKELGLLK